jgi:hypothetical protein
MKQLRILFVLFYPLLSFSQTDEVEWKSHSTSKFSISYPENWLLDLTGQYNAEFFLFSEKEGEEDQFIENINLMIQDLKGLGIDLKEYTDITVKQVKEMLTNGELVENKTITKNGKSYQRLSYTGIQNEMDIYFLQYFWVVKEKAIILTFVSETSTLTEYEKTAEQIMNSFEVK